MWPAQLNNKDLISIVRIYIVSSGPDNTIYTYKYVEGIELIRKYNILLVPKSKQQSVLDWYHKILVHPGVSRMIEIIFL